VRAFTRIAGNLSSAAQIRRDLLAISRLWIITALTVRSGIFSRGRAVVGRDYGRLAGQ